MTDSVDISRVDFERYRNQLKTFLQTQSQFKDYDFEGSNMAVMLDLLSYNTFQNVFYDNMAISEMFMDSARLRNSVISHAKSLNYVPRSKVSSSAKIKVRLNVDDNIPFVTIPKRTKFTSPSSNGRMFSFYTHETNTILPVDNVYESEEIEIFEGLLAEEQYFALANENKFYTITNKNVDTNTLRVYVTSLDGIEEEYVKADSLFGLNQNSKVFYIQLTDENYEIYFGKDMFGRQPKVNETIKLEYLISTGPSANGIKRFSKSESIGGYSIYSVSTVANSFGGANEESISSIKFYAPKSIQVQERAVTELDYEILLKNKFPEVQSVSVVGGENVDPPQYGRVLVYVDTVNANGISENIKFKIKTYLDQRVPLGINTVITSPDFFFLEVASTVTYNPNKTTKTYSDIKQSVSDAINAFNIDNLNTFGVTYAHSKFISAIDAADVDIYSNQTNVRLFCEKNVDTTKRNDFTIRFANELTPIADYAIRSLQSQVPNHPFIPKLESERTDRLPTVSSSVFIYNGKRVYIRDNGFGVLQIIQNTEDRDIIIDKNVGSVDYKSGVVKIINFRPSSVLGVFKVFASLKNNDIASPRGSILTIRPKDVSINISAD